MADPNKWRAKIKELQNQVSTAQKAGDFARVKKLKNDLRRVAAVPFDSKIKQIENKAANPQTPSPHDPSGDRSARPNNSMRDELLNREKEQLNKAQGLGKPESNRQGEYQGAGRSLHAHRNGSSAEEEDLDVQSDQDDADSANERAGQGFNAASRPQSRQPEEESRPSDSGDDSGDTDSSRDKNASSKGGPSIQNAVANRVKAAAKKLAQQAAKKLATFIATNPYAWIIIIGIIIISIVGVILFSYMFGSAGQSPSPTGQSATQPYDPVKDKHFLQGVLQLSGDKAIAQLASETFLTGLKGDLQKLKDETTASSRYDKSDIISKIDEITVNITAYTAASDKDKATAGGKVIQGVKDLINIFGTIPNFSGASGSPLPKNVVPTNYSDASNLHTYTPLRPCPGPNCPNPNLKHRTFQQFKKNTCDADDLSLPSGTTITAAFGGKVVLNDKDGMGHQVVFVQSGDGYIATYAHIDSSVKLNQIVAYTDKIGTVANLKTGSHLHFELSRGGKCMVTTEQDLNDAKLNKKQAGYYLWQRMLSVLKATS